MEPTTLRTPATRRLSARICTLTALALGIILAVLYYGGDEAALPTLYLFGPRWLAALPLIVLAPVAVYSRSWLGMARRDYWAAVGWPIPGGQLNIGRMFASDRPALQKFRVVTWNSGGSRLGPDFHQFMDDVDPTILVCQEANLSEADLPTGWKVVGRGGNRVASRLPIRPDGSLSLAPIGAPGGLDRYSLNTPDGELLLVNLHLPTPRPGIEAAIASRGRDLTELRRIIEIRGEASRVARRWLSERSENMILAGDFNMPVESRIYRRSWSDFGNAFNDAGTGWGTTKQTRWFGTRIDHILYSAPWRCRKAWIGPAMGSDHRPLIADLEWSDSVD